MDNTPSIKLQIMQLIVSLMQPLVQNGTFRKVARSHDLALNEAVRPALQIYDGTERLMRKDNRGRTYHFDIGLKILL